MNPECSICIQPIHPIGQVYTICSHYFHLNCINAWLNQNSTCPICRQDLDASKINIIYWPNTNTIKIRRNKELEIRYYPNGSIKYHIYIDSYNKCLSGLFYTKNGKTIHYNDNKTIQKNIDKFRTIDHYGESILEHF